MHTPGLKTADEISTQSLRAWNKYHLYAQTPTKKQIRIQTPQFKHKDVLEYKPFNYLNNIKQLVWCTLKR